MGLGYPRCIYSDWFFFLFILIYFFWKDLLLLKSHPLPHTVGLRRLFDLFVNVQFDGVLVSDVFF